MVLGRGEARPQQKSIKNVSTKDVRRLGIGLWFRFRNKLNNINTVVILSRDRITTIVILSRGYSITLHLDDKCRSALWPCIYLLCSY